MSRDAGEILKRSTRASRGGPGSDGGFVVDNLDSEVDAGAEEAWQKEIQRRLAELDSGAVKAIPWSEARSRLLAKLSE